MLGDIASVERGKFSPRPRNNPIYYGGQYPFIQTGDVAKADKYIVKYSQSLNELGLAVSRIFPKNTIAITIAANIGDVGILGCAMAFPDSLVGIIPNDKIDVDWLYYIMQFNKTVLDSLAPENAQKNINLEILRTFALEVSPLPEQIQIAAILSTWDDSLATLAKLIDTKREQKRALAEQLLTGKRRLKEFKEEWIETRLGEHIFEVSSRNKGSKTSRVLSVTNHSGFVLPEEQFSKRVASENISNYKIVLNGQFAYNPSRLNVGSLARLDKFEDGIVSPLYVVFDVKNSISSNYLLYWLDSPVAENRIKAGIQGSVRDSVSFDALSSFKIKVPPVMEQQAIASVLSALDTEIALLTRQQAKVQEQKRGLMDLLLTGKVRVQVPEEVPA